MNVQAISSHNFSQVTNFAQPPVRGWQWQQRAVKRINAWEMQLEIKLPNFLVQKKIDELGAEIEKKFSPLTEFNNWLNKNEQGDWYKQLALFLVKLPIKAARNIIQQLYQIIRGLVYGIIHPLQALNSIAKILVLLPYEYAQPEMWSKTGAGFIGNSLGEAAIAGGLVSVISVGVGAALIVGGVSAGTLKTILEAEKGQKLEGAKKYLLKQAQELPEAMLTSFYMGVIIGGIRRAVKELEAPKQPKRKQELQAVEAEAEKRAPDFYQVVETCRNNPEGYPPVAYAVKLGRHDVVKFLIDHKESVNAATPGFSVWAEMNPTSDHSYDVIIGTQPGYTPLELAIQRNDVTMVEILTSYDPTNRAIVDQSTTRWENLWKGYGNTMHDVYYTYKVTTTPLTSAIASGNKEIVELIVKAYPTKESLFQALEQVKATQQESLMRMWLEQSGYLLKGEYTAVTDEAVKVFLSHTLQEAIASGDVSSVQQLLTNGWQVSKSEVAQLIATKNPSMIELLQKSAHLQPGVNPALIAIEVGSVDVLRNYIQQGVSFEGLLLSAVELKQKSVVEYLLELSIGKDELAVAYQKAYELHAYDIMELLEAKK